MFVDITDFKLEAALMHAFMFPYCCAKISKERAWIIKHRGGVRRGGSILDIAAP